MYISNIERDENWVYIVTFSPNWLERIFNVQPKIKKFKDTGSTYMFGGGHVYRNQQGEELSNGSYIGESIDKFRRSW